MGSSEEVRTGTGATGTAPGEGDAAAATTAAETPQTADDGAAGQPTAESAAAPGADAAGGTATPPAAKQGWSRRERGLLAGVICLAAATVALAVLTVLSAVPSGAAAKVDGFYIDEAEVEAYAQEFRARYQLTDDADWASYLLSANLNAGTFRQNGINQIAMNELIDRKAAELGVEPTDEEVQEQVDAMREEVAAGDDDLWADTLELYGTSEERLAAQLYTNLAEQAVYAAEVPVPEATDAQTASYVASAKASTTDVHTWRITFTGDDQWERAQECAERIALAGDELDADVFSGFALAYSDDADVEQDGGDAGWEAEGGSDEYGEIAASLADGEVSEPTSIDADDCAVIVYRDASYTYPDADACEELDLGGLDATLADALRAQASDALWASDCDAYLANLLGAAKITYYPLPDGASYDVDITLAAATSTADAEADADDGDASDDADADDADGGDGGR